MAKRTCTWPDAETGEPCGLPHKARGFCRRHYRQWMREHPDAESLAPEILGWPDNLFARAVVTDEGCILWNGRTVAGYGTVRKPGELPRGVHVHAWELEHDQRVPKGMTVDHLCHDPERCEEGPECLHRQCLNTEHMKLETPRGNALRGNSPAAKHAAQTLCMYGHDLAPKVVRGVVTGRWCPRCEQDTRAWKWWRKNRWRFP